MTIEQQVRAILKGLREPMPARNARCTCVGTVAIDCEAHGNMMQIEEAVAALMRLVEPPSSSVQIESQCEALTEAIRAAKASGQFGHGWLLEAALETLRWVQGRRSGGESAA